MFFFGLKVGFGGFTGDEELIGGPGDPSVEDCEVSALESKIEEVFGRPQQQQCQERFS